MYIWETAILFHYKQWRISNKQERDGSFVPPPPQIKILLFAFGVIMFITEYHNYRRCEIRAALVGTQVKFYLEVGMNPVVVENPQRSEFSFGLRYEAMRVSCRGIVKDVPNSCILDRDGKIKHALTKVFPKKLQISYHYAKYSERERSR